MVSARYYIYRNLQSNDLSNNYYRWSCRYRAKVGTPRGGTDFVVGRGVEFRVSEAGHARVIREQRKNVHAYAVCDSIDRYQHPSVTASLVARASRASYNPYLSKHFHDSTGLIAGADVVICTPEGMYLINPRYLPEGAADPE